MKRETCYAHDRAAWRRWLKKHGNSSSGVWLIFYKKHTGKPSVTYREALEEALCFGWIDSILKRIDEKRYMQRFTPRADPTHWSIANVRHMRRLIAEGRMTDAGMRVLGVPLDQKVADGPIQDSGLNKAKKKQARVPGFIRAAIGQNRKAAAFWQELAPGYRRRYIGWIMNAKGEATRLRRLAEVVGYLACGTKSVLK
jgi:uncharacterized protein YdeI (YjbR/CyaY-like superfamily)